MRKALIFSRINHIETWTSIFEKSTIFTNYTIISCSNKAPKNRLMALVHSHFKSIDPSTIQIPLRSVEVQEVIARCRLLRNLDADFSKKLLQAFYLALQSIVEDEKPELVISKAVDFFTTDLLERIAKKQGIKSIQICASCISNRFMIASNNNFLHLSNNSSPEFENSLIKEVTSSSFAPFISNKKKNFLEEYFKLRIKYSMREFYLQGLKVLNQDYLNPEYLMNLKKGTDYYFKISDSWHINKIIDYQWSDKLQETSPDKRVFIALQFNPECSTDYWVKNMRMVNHQACLERIVNQLTDHGYYVFIKDHPNMIARRKYDYFQNIYDNPRISIVPYEINSQYMLKECVNTFTWTGTIGLQSAMQGNCSMLTREMYYSTEDDFLYIENFDSINRIDQLIHTFNVKNKSLINKQRIAKKISQMTLPGNCINIWKKKADHSQKQQQTKLVSASLDNFFSSELYSNL